jgi:hypothetical protein
MRGVKNSSTVGRSSEVPGTWLSQNCCQKNEAAWAGHARDRSNITGVILDMLHDHRADDNVDVIGWQSRQTPAIGKNRRPSRQRGEALQAHWGYVYARDSRSSRQQAIRRKGRDELTISATDVQQMEWRRLGKEQCPQAWRNPAREEVNSMSRVLLELLGREPRGCLALRHYRSYRRHRR